MALDFSTLRKKMVLGPEHHQFQLIKPVSNSPIGQVWHAYDLTTGDDDESRTRVALEIINPSLIQDTETLASFKTQVTRCTHLDHKHLAKVHGYFQSREGWLFVAMEPVSTRSLARILIEDGYKQLNAEKARVILQQTAVALDYIAKRQLSHGDLTPWNLIITHEVGVKLVNIGFRQPLLRAIQDSGQRVLNTEYHAPEAFSTDSLPSSADIYSFACLVYLMFGGRAPFNAEQPATERDLEALSPPPSFNEQQWQILLQALDENPGIRPASASELLKQLFAVANSALKADTPLSAHSSSSEDNSPVPTTTAEPASTATPPGKGPGWGMASIALLLGLGAGTALGYLLASNQQQDQKQQLIDQVAKVQSLLQKPASADSKLILGKEFAQLRKLAPGSELLQQLGSQIDSYNARLTRDPVNNRSNTANPQQKLTAGLADQRIGEVFKDEIIPGVFGPNMITIPTGSFRMGDLDRNGDDNELPVHEVSISHQFALSQKEVSFAEYDLFALSTGRPLPSDEGWGRGNRPVINISWNDANAYAYWIRQQTGQPYRLPSEAEWEYAARAGSQTLYWWGSEVGTNNAACDDCGSSFDGKQAAPTGSFPPNPFGLYDMNGNVYEWVSDCYNESYDQAPNDGSSWDVGLCNYRVMRGGSWYDIPRLIRSASRYRHPPNATRNTWGFRLALDLGSN